ncbi:MAG: aromatic ring-hydroxylating oxygenase subunit alpha [Alphaproteobacteria bacterium]
MTREHLFEMARHTIGHGKAGTMEQADGVMKLPASYYYDQDRFTLELERIHHRVPLLLAAGCELPQGGDFKTIDVTGSSVLLSRGKDGTVRGFMNACTHRGATLVRDECGNRSRFTCPYHGWTFAQDGRLVGVAAQQDFGEIDKAEYGLKEIPVLESAGLIWAVLNPDSQVNIKGFLAGYDDVLAAFGFADWDYVSKRTFEGPNWKIAYDGYLEYYHIPTLHSETFGTDSTNRGLYYAWGPHQHIKTPAMDKGHAATEVLGYLAELAELPEKDWSMEVLTYGIWTVFPCASIAPFAGGGRGVMFSQILPGETVGESITTQYYLMEKAPEGEALEAAEAQFDFFQEVVMTEDYAMGFSIQKSLPGSGIDHVPLGRNELGNQRFHQWVDDILACETDDDLNQLFAASERGAGLPRMAAE